MQKQKRSQTIYNFNLQLNFAPITQSCRLQSGKLPADNVHCRLCFLQWLTRGLAQRQTFTRFKFTLLTIKLYRHRCETRRRII